MNLGEIINRFPHLNAVVIGDAMLDHYIFGQALRISPEAPVMVIDERTTQSVPGGAANVAINFRALGATCQFIGVVGDDPQSTILAKSLEDRGISQNGLVIDPSRPTTLKTRIVANHAHQVLRIDRESKLPISDGIKNALLNQAISAIEKCDILMLSDYAKGCLTKDLVAQLIELAKSKSVPVVANPKPSTATWYQGATLLSLNQFEAAVSSNQAQVSVENAIQTATHLREKFQTKGLIVTLRENGMAGSWENLDSIVPAVPVEVYDEAGAGDTAIATLALAIASGADGKTAMELAVRTAARVVAKVGVASVTVDELKKIAMEKVS